MSSDFNLLNESNHLVCDAIPDPPRILNEDDIKQSLHEDIETNENKSNASADANDSLPSNSASSANKIPDLKYLKSKKRPKSKTATETIINYNVINSANVKIGPTTKYEYNVNNFPKSDYASENKFHTEELVKEMLPQIQKLSKSKLEISKDDIFLIKTHLGKGWKEVIQKLGFSIGQLDQISENHKHKGIDEVIYRILIDWKQSCTKEATLGKIVCAMWFSHEYDCVERLAKIHSI